MSKKPAQVANSSSSSKSSKSKNATRSDADARARDDCVASILQLLLAQIEQHINDKLIFPRILAHAVGRTMAEMVHMVSVAHVQRMEDWLVHLEGSAPQEWDFPEEPLVPLIDSWARGVVPLKKMPGRCSSPEQEQIKNAEELKPAAVSKQPRRGSAMPLSQYQEAIPARRRSSDLGSKQGLRGSLRRFSDGFYPLDPNRKVKFQEKGGSSSVDDVGKELAVHARRSSTPPPMDFFQEQEKAAESLKMNDVTRRSSLTTGKEDKPQAKGLSNKALSSTQKKAG